MQRVIPVLVLATLFSVSGNSRASLITFTTGHTGADTKINSGASSEWDFQCCRRDGRSRRSRGSSK